MVNINIRYGDKNNCYGFLLFINIFRFQQLFIDFILQTSVLEILNFRNSYIRGRNESPLYEILQAIVMEVGLKIDLLKYKEV